MGTRLKNLVHPVADGLLREDHLGYAVEMKSSRKAQSPSDRVVCFCYNVTEQVIVDAIRGGCSSLMDIRRETYASTGCAGCSEEVKKLLRKNMSKPQSASVGESGNGESGSSSGGK